MRDGVGTPGDAAEITSEAYLSALHLVMIVAYADDEFTPDERRMLHGQVQGLARTVADARGFKTFIDSLPEHSESKRWAEGALQVIKQTLVEPEARLDAFAMALEMARADGVISMPEMQALLEIADQLEIDPEFARARLKKVRLTPPDKLPDLDRTPWARR